MVEKELIKGKWYKDHRNQYTKSSGDTYNEYLLGTEHYYDNKLRDARDYTTWVFYKIDIVGLATLKELKSLAFLNLGGLFADFLKNLLYALSTL